MNIIFQVNGGLGKVIASTAVCASIKAKYPDDKLIVVSGYPDVFINNPYVDRAFSFGQQMYFYEDYIKDEEILLLAHDPYLETKHIKQEEHLIETWCNLFDLPLIKTIGELFLTQKEVDFFKHKFTSDKPILLIQTNGGGESETKYSWARDMPSFVVENIVNRYKEDYNIIHIRREDQLKYDGTYSVTDNFRALLVLIYLSDKRILIDSFGQHAAAALNKPSTVLWIVNKPNVFGYDIHTNIEANHETFKPELKNAYLNKYSIGGDPLEFPYQNELEIFNMIKIFESIEDNIE
jgi:hypothetical protein